MVAKREAQFYCVHWADVALIAPLAWEILADIEI
jgi:hypothetical protein